MVDSDHRAQSAEINPEEWAETLAWGEWALRAHMDGTFRDFQRALSTLRLEPTKPGEAERKVMVSLARLREFLGLSVEIQTQPEEVEL